MEPHKGWTSWGKPTWGVTGGESVSFSAGGFQVSCGFCLETAFYGFFEWLLSNGLRGIYPIGRPKMGDPEYHGVCLHLFNPFGAHPLQGIMGILQPTSASIPKHLDICAWDIPSVYGNLNRTHSDQPSAWGMPLVSKSISESAHPQPCLHPSSSKCWYMERLSCEAYWGVPYFRPLPEANSGGYSLDILGPCNSLFLRRIFMANLRDPAKKKG